MTPSLPPPAPAAHTQETENNKHSSREKPLLPSSPRARAPNPMKEASGRLLGDNGPCLSARTPPGTAPQSRTGPAVLPDTTATPGDSRECDAGPGIWNPGLEPTVPWLRSLKMEAGWTSCDGEDKGERLLRVGGAAGLHFRSSGEGESSYPLLS